MTFNELGLTKPLLMALNDMGYQNPTSIQQQAIPHILKGNDVFGCAQTGTGKTAAFALPILHQLASVQNEKKHIKALIIAPTRELVSQIGESIKQYSKHLSIASANIFGGVSQHHQQKEIERGVDILVATPGRLMDLMQQKLVKLDHLEYFVLDEADRMLDMGFINDIKRIISRLPAKRQTLFFSATIAPNIMALAQTLLKNPVKVSTTPVSSTNVLVEQSLYYVAKEDKKRLLTYLLNDDKIGHVLVFTRTKRGADNVAKDLNKSGISSEAIHGNKSQGAREKSLARFKDRKIRVLVATDIASRGIDVDRLSHVINYEIPEQAETYVHRIGRTGRAGLTGKALSFCTNEEVSYMKDIYKLIKREIDIVAVHPFSKPSSPVQIKKINFKQKSKTIKHEKRNSKIF
ncbi:MAG TPA: DEAD/DEAH box helicase [Bacteroidia bacterium]|jgi:ATP-dependent RNA helicase RhlE|nr:DEAD/DEAH box helicase [Bacteroidia bacterium]